MEQRSKFVDRIYRVDGIFPLITNLEYFPAEILLNIFALIDDNSLRALAITTARFELTAQIVLSERYANKYFVIKDASYNKQQMQHQYRAVISHFGQLIKAISIHGFRGIDETHWLIQMLNTHASQLEKLEFFDCHFKSAESILSQYLSITHLTFQMCTSDAIVHMPNFHNLRHFEARDFIDIENSSYEEIMRNNPQLECLMVCNSNEDPLAIISHADKHLKHLKRFHLSNDSDALEFTTVRSMETFLNLATNLQSLGLSMCNDSVELLQMLSSRCTNIQCLELVHFGGDLSQEIIEVLRSFQNITTISLAMDAYQFDIESLLKSYSYLRHLSITLRLEMPPTNEFILSLLRECRNLEKITVNSIIRQYRHSFNVIFYQDSNEDAIMDDYLFDYVPDFEENPIKRNINLQFCDDFVEITRNRRVTLEMQENCRIIANVSKHEVIWRNMLVHWKGYDACENRSELQLLDLANTKYDKGTGQLQSFDQILEFLDVSSLYALFNTCKRSRQLVMSYVERQFVQERKFIITDEFDINYDAVRMFGHYATIIEANLINDDEDLPTLIKQCCPNLKKLILNQICEYHTRVYRYRFIFPQLRHFVYKSVNDKTYFDLSRLPESQLETLEFKSDVWLLASDFKPYLLSNLKRIKFHRPNDTTTSFVQAVSHVEVVFDS